ncbi:META domain-containing protein [Anabaena sp. PCC 7108]|uniref:META domain-containing protein n=1 Tax=Anabaena sp. PCC 7108 TaxID=163908 RepID=UPI000349C8B2|nr:META domain-containing protein [Anabaena sp. PCC 7108]
MTRSFLKSAFCLPLAVVCLLGFTGKAFAEFGDTPNGSYYLIDGMDTIEPGDRSFKINFDRAKNKVTGQTLCTNYTADYIGDEYGSIKMSNLVVTRKSAEGTCADPLANQKQETEYFDNLTAMKQYYIMSQPGINLLLLINTDSQKDFAFIKGY